MELLSHYVIYFDDRFTSGLGGWQDNNVNKGQSFDVVWGKISLFIYRFLRNNYIHFVAKIYTKIRVLSNRDINYIDLVVAK